MQVKTLVFTEPRHLIIRESTYDPATLPETFLAGPTIWSLVSAGTELDGFYLNSAGYFRYPTIPGYACVFRVEQVGSAVADFCVGEYVLCMGKHTSWQVMPADVCVKIPAGVDLKEAPFARMAGISMASLSRCQIHPGENVLVTGLGPVGLMALQIFENLGYNAVGIDPNPDRVALAGQKSGCPAYTQLPETLESTFGLALECSGTQQATLTCCQGLRMGGELSLVGVPWKQTGDVQSYLILDKIFHKYLTCHTGWECDLPMNPTQAQPDGRCNHFRLALKLMSKGLIRMDGLETIYSYRDAQQMYDALYHKTEQHVSVLLRWDD